ncbi:hypothetical protein ACBG85_17000 [Rhodococcus sp. NyZ502]|uniref:hypothetical protein n=1 Tax=Rhodococcus sp. NyZ502 TaxID=3242855 RepID=UPI003557B268
MAIGVEDSTPIASAVRRALTAGAQTAESTALTPILAMPRARSGLAKTEREMSAY